MWSHEIGKDLVLEEYMRREAGRILDCYGHHPSFTMLCLGNELRGDYSRLDRIVADLKKTDPSRLYTFSADNRRKEPGPHSDYFVTLDPGGSRIRIAGVRFTVDAPSSDYDFADKVQRHKVPLVAHELGQWAMNPDWQDLGEYSGVLRPRNLEHYRKQCFANGFEPQARALAAASGAFAWLIYKEDVEAALRTPNLAGFQLLGLSDFPGQGEALVGALNVFWRSKGIVTPARFREFCDRLVLLAKIPKFVWTTNETLEAVLLASNYSQAAFRQPVHWKLSVNDREYRSGVCDPVQVSSGQVGEIGPIRVPLQDAAAPARLDLSVTAGAVRNRWTAWLYPAESAPEPARGFEEVSEVMSALAALRLGATVLYLHPADRHPANARRMRFLPVFWSKSWMPNQPGTMGVFCDPGHPALKLFPTEAHSHWQWWELTERAPVFELPPSLRGSECISVIDDFHTCQRLAGVFEARVGPGKLLAVSFDLKSNLAGRPAARQLLASLRSYIGSKQFSPKLTLEESSLRTILSTEIAASSASADNTSKRMPYAQP